MSYFNKNRPWFMSKYKDPRCLKHIRLNTGVYVGGGSSGASCLVKVPKLNASAKIWRTFYEMFPYFKEVLQSSNYIARSGNWALVYLKPHYMSANTKEISDRHSRSVVKIRTDIIQL